MPPPRPTPEGDRKLCGEETGISITVNNNFITNHKIGKFFS
jgi:hypothetical protein